MNVGFVDPEPFDEAADVRQRRLADADDADLLASRPDATLQRPGSSLASAAAVIQPAVPPPRTTTRVCVSANIPLPGGISMQRLLCASYRSFRHSRIFISETEACDLAVADSSQLPHFVNLGSQPQLLARPNVHYPAPDWAKARKCGLVSVTSTRGEHLMAFYRTCGIRPLPAAALLRCRSFALWPFAPIAAGDRCHDATRQQASATAPAVSWPTLDQPRE